MLEVGSIVAQRYEVENVVAVGGMATVYRVRHMDLGTTHALKLLLHQSEALSDRLLLEGQIQARIGHPNVVSVTDVIRIDNQIGLLMEFIDANSLRLAATWADAGGWCLFNDTRFGCVHGASWDFASRFKTGQYPSSQEETPSANGYRLWHRAGSV